MTIVSAITNAGMPITTASEDVYIRVLEEIPNSLLATLSPPIRLRMLTGFPLRFTLESMNRRSNIYCAAVRECSGRASATSTAGSAGGESGSSTGGSLDGFSPSTGSGLPSFLAKYVSITCLAIGAPR